MTKEEWYRQLFEHLSASKFRSSFHLKQKDIVYIKGKRIGCNSGACQRFYRQKGGTGSDSKRWKADTHAGASGFCRPACNGNLLPGVHSEVAQDTAGKRTEPGAEGILGGCDYDLDRKRVVIL